MQVRTYLTLLLLFLPTMIMGQIPGAQPFGNYPTSEELAKAKNLLDQVGKRNQIWKVGNFDVFQRDTFKGEVTFDPSDDTVVSIEQIPVNKDTKATPLFWYKATRLGETELKRHVFQPQATSYWILEAVKPGTVTVKVWGNGEAGSGPVIVDRLVIQVGDIIPSPPPPVALSIVSISPSDIISGDLIIIKGTGFTSDAKVTYNGVVLPSAVNSSTVIQVTAPVVTAITLQPLVITSNGQQVSQMLVISPSPIVQPPPPPADKLGFIAFASTEGAKVADKSLSAALAMNFEEVATKLNDTAMTEADATKLLTEKNRATLGASRAIWLPFFVAWAAKADQHNNNGTMSTKQDYVTAYRETATGLRMVK